MTTIGEAFDAMGYALKSSETVCIATLLPGGVMVERSLHEVAGEPIGQNRYFSTGTFPVDIRWGKHARTGDNVERILEMPFDFDLKDFLDVDKEELYDLDDDELEGYIQSLQDVVEGVFKRLGLPIHRLDYTGYGLSAHINMPLHPKDAVPTLRDIHKGIVRKINSVFGGVLADRQVSDAGSRIMRLIGGLNVGTYRDGTQAPARQTRNLYTVDEGYVDEARLRAAADMIAWSKSPIPQGSGPISDEDLTAIVDAYKPYHVNGQKHFMALAVAGQLAKAGVQEDQALAVIEALSVDDQKPWDRKKCVRDTYDKARMGAEIAGFYALKGMVPDEAIARVDGILSKLRRTAGPRLIAFKSDGDKKNPENNIVMFNPPVVPESCMYGWFGRHRDIMAPTTMAADAFHLGASLAVCGASMARRVSVIYAGDRVYGNQYNLLVGRTGSSYKDTAAKRAYSLPDFAQAYAPHGTILREYALVHDIASREAMVKMFASTPNVLLFSSEIVALFKASQRDKTSTLLDGLIHVWDAPAAIENNSLSARQNNGSIALNPTLSIIGGIQPGRLEQEMTETVMSSGLGNRYGFFMGNAKGKAATTAEIDERAAGENFLELHNAIRSYGEGSVLRLSPDAARRWNDWFMSQEEEIDELANDMKVRHPLMIHKWALCYAVSDGAREIGLQHLEPAIALCEWMWDCVKQVLPSWGVTNDRKIEERIITVLSQRQPMTKRDLNRYVRGKWTAREYQSVFRAMKDNQQIVVDATDRFVALSEEAFKDGARKD